MNNIIKQAYKNKYMLDLCIIKHIKELKVLYDYEIILKKEYKNYNKELADLYILLQIFFEDKQELVENRVSKFISNILGVADNE